MRILKYLTVIASVMFLTSCDKHGLDLADGNEQPMDENMAELRIHYAEPIKTGAASRFDSLYINNKLYANSTNAFGATNVMPNSNKFYQAPIGTVNMKCWRKSTDPVYDFDFTASKGKQEVFIYDLEQAPIVLNTSFPYYSTAASGTAATWGADSTAYVEFYNFLYEVYEDGNKVPYEGTLQLQYQDLRDAEKWHNIGEPVAFGQASGRAEVRIIKSDGVNNGTRTVKYRMVDADGNPLKYITNKGVEAEYSLNYDTTNGRVYMFYSWGIRTSKTIVTSLVGKAIH